MNNSATNQIVFGVYAASTTQAALLGSATDHTIGSSVKIACTFGPDRFAVTANGGPVLADTAGNIPGGLDSFWLGGASETANRPTLVLYRVLFFAGTMTDTELVAAGGG